MRTYLSGLVLLVTGFASNVGAQFQVITPPHGGVPIVAGGYYTAGTVFANGMAYPNGALVQQGGAFRQASYSAPQFNGYQSFGSGYSGVVYPQHSYYGTSYPSFGLGINFGNAGFGYNPGYSGYGLNSFPSNYGYGGYSNFGTNYGRGYSGNRGNGGRRR